MALRCVLLVVFALVAACSTTPRQTSPASAHHKVGKPYTVFGKTYYPREDRSYDAVGVASWYGDAFHGKRTANGEIFDKTRLSAAHTTLPLPSLVEVENLENGRRVLVRVNDRGPFVGDRIIDLSHAAARELDFERKGLARVRVRYVGEARLADLAPRPGDRRAVRMAAREAPTPKPRFVEPVRAAPVATAEARREPPPDMALLIETALSAPAEPPAPEYWITVAAYEDLNDLERARIDHGLLGEHRIVTDDAGAAAPRFVLQSGPFFDAASMEARLAALREAGYPAAAAAPVCVALAPESDIATC